MLADVIEAVGPKLGDARAGRPPDHYGALIRAIVGQQLSTKAARSIFLRLTERFDGRTPTPEQVLDGLAHRHFALRNLARRGRLA